jgi:hypothetical protein
MRQATKHTVLTFIAPVKAAKTEELRKLLEIIREKPEVNTLVPFRSLELLHFASFVLHDSHRKCGYGPCLIFENNFDGPLDAYLNNLYVHAGKGLHEIYSCCEDYTVPNASDQQGMLAYLTAHVVRPNAYHIGNTGRSAKRILQEKELRESLETHADALQRSVPPVQANKLLASFQALVRSHPQWSWVSEFGPRQTFMQRFVAYLKLVLGFVGAVVLLVIFCIPALIGFLVLRHKERTDKVQSDPAKIGNVQDLVKTEDRTPSVQNHMASITIVKRGWLRRFILRVVLWAVNLLARATATHGELSRIPSIHFAHWSLIDHGHRLLFLSNFDGSWENYLDDFIDKASHGLTAVWSNTLNFPRTSFLAFEGATDGPRFKAVARDSQTVTNAWYSAYWNLTVQGIDNNSSIRERVLTSLDPKAAGEWLQRL